MKYIYTLIFISLLHISYSQSFLNALNNKSDYNILCGSPLSQKYGQVKALKVIYDLESEKIFFINSKYYDYHYEFSCSELNYTHTLDYFNKHNYSQVKTRRFLLANINYYQNLNIFSLEFSPADLITIKQIFKIYKIISTKSFIGNKLHVFINTYKLQKQEKEISLHSKILKPSFLYKKLQYQAINKGKTCGIFKIINSLEEEIDNITERDIIYIKGTPIYIPIVSGVLTDEFQTPLSHLSILGKNRKIPISAYKNISTYKLEIYNKQKVCYQVLSDTFLINKVEDNNIKRIKRREIKLKHNLSVDSLIDISYLKNNAYKYVGNKASNFAILHKISLKNNFKTPENAFAIPFYYYHKHTNKKPIKQLIDKLLKNKEINNKELKTQLKEIRRAIKNAKIDTSLIHNINIKAKREKQFPRLRFRSSTNAEDTKGFSGAGLYDSKTGIINAKNKTFSSAIKKVWASLWNYRAYKEREYYNIDHKNVFMGILVHRSFPNEHINGVAITKNIYRKNYYGFILNSQLGNNNVVKPKAGIINEQIICYPQLKNSLYNNKKAIDIITLSNINKEKLLMNKNEIFNIAQQLNIIKRKIIKRNYNSKSFLNKGLDIEFKIDGENRQLYFKQVRVYNE